MTSPSKASTNSGMSDISLIHSKEIEIYGHRGVGCSIVGGDSQFPENSFIAFQKAIDLGLSGVELDVWMSKDEQVVVIHGGGSDLDGFLYETVIDGDYHVEGQSDVIEMDGVRRLRRIEDMRYNELQKSGHLKLRKPWAIHRQQLNEQICGIIPTPNDQSSDFSFENAKNFRRLTKLELENARQDYLLSLDPYIDVDNVDNVVSEVPLLSEVFARFHGKLRFNVELKGTNPLLGQAVLDLAKPFPGVISRISSFLWTTSALEGEVDDCHKQSQLLEQSTSSSPSSEAYIIRPDDLSSPTSVMLQDSLNVVPGYSVMQSNSVIPFSSDILTSPNGFVPNDLLYPILDNSLNVPLALLFSGYKIPSISYILRCLRKYKAEWIHLPQSFEIADGIDSRNIAEMKQEFLNRHGVERLLANFPLHCSIGHGYHPHRSQREKVLLDMIQLFYLTKELHRNEHKVLIYGSHANEDPSILELCLLCDIDGLCPNDVTSALLLTRRFQKH